VSNIPHAFPLGELVPVLEFPHIGEEEPFAHLVTVDTRPGGVAFRVLTQVCHCSTVRAA
jgi:hypothetical protein